MKPRTSSIRKNFQRLMLIPILTSSVVFAYAQGVKADDSDYHGNINIMEIKPHGETPLKLYVLNCGEIVVHDAGVFNPSLAGQEKILSDSCYVIKHPKGTVVWDAGLPDAIADLPNGFDAGGGLFTVFVNKTFQSQLQAIDVDPANVTYIAMSHLHFDHTGNANLFTNATWLIQQPEYDIAFTDQGIADGFNPDSYSELANNPTKVLHGDYDVFGDKSVVIVSTPGHTPGHQSLYLDLPETGPVVLSGDLYHFQLNRDTYVVPGFNTSIRETIHSFVGIDNFLDSSHAKMWIQHDKPTFDSLMHAPNYYQ